MKTIQINLIQLASVLLAVIVVIIGATFIGMHLEDAAMIMAVVLGAIGLLAAGWLAGLITVQKFSIKEETKVPENPSVQIEKATKRYSPQPVVYED